MSERNFWKNLLNAFADDDAADMMLSSEERQAMDKFFNDFTSAVKEIKETGTPITDKEEDELFNRMGESGEYRRGYEAAIRHGKIVDSLDRMAPNRHERQ